LSVELAAVSGWRVAPIGALEGVGGMGQACQAAQTRHRLRLKAKQVSAVAVVLRRAEK